MSERDPFNPKPLEAEPIEPPPAPLGNPPDPFLNGLEPDPDRPSLQPELQESETQGAGAQEPPALEGSKD